MGKHHMSLFTNEQACIKALLELHNGGRDIDCDPMFYKGGFYKDGVNIPKIIFDINPRIVHCPEGNAEALPLDGASIDSIILDPLFIFGIHGKAAGYYTSRTMGILKDFAELERHYKAILSEAHRVLKPQGVCIFKCQDYTDSRTTLTHCKVYEWATAVGFYAKDLAILNIPQTKVYNGNTTQRHLRKTHTYSVSYPRVQKEGAIMKNKKIYELVETSGKYHAAEKGNPTNTIVLSNDTDKKAAIIEIEKINTTYYITDYSPEEIAKFWNDIDLERVNDFFSQLLGLEINLEKHTSGNGDSITHSICDNTNIALRNKVTAAAWSEMTVTFAGAFKKSLRMARSL